MNESLFHALTYSNSADILAANRLLAAIAHEHLKDHQSPNIASNRHEISSQLRHQFGPLCPDRQAQGCVEPRNKNQE
jgi:hypothetical protein